MGAAEALVLVLVMRNARDVAGPGAEVLDAFAAVQSRDVMSNAPACVT
ncbi:MAG: hypothetical protein U1E52_05250 [Geminicoccaceae bacterium]